MTSFVPAPIQQYFDSNSVELTGGLLYTYAAGTTTPLAVYTDSTGATAFPNPIVLNSRGEPTATGPSLGVWLTAGVGYKFVLSPPGDTNPPTNPIWTIDQISAGGSSGSSLTTVSDSGTTNALVVTLSPAPTSYTLGLSFVVKVANTVSGATTINVNGLGLKSVVFNNAAIASGMLVSGQLYLLCYDGTYFEVLSVPGAGGWVTPSYLAPIAAGTVLGNNGGSTATPTAIPLTTIQGSFASGQYGFFATSTLPSNWLLCNGSAISRSTYASLFAAIGTTYGSGDGSTTFNLPPFQGVFPRGLNTTGTGPDPSRSLGVTQQDAMQGHYHNPLSGVTQFLTTVGLGGPNLTTGGGNYGSTYTTGSPVTDGTNGTPRTSTETRPVNLAMVIAIHV